MSDDLVAFKQDRAAMLKAATVPAVLAYLNTYGEQGQIDRYERDLLERGAYRAALALLAGVHRARLSLTDGTMTDAELAESRVWLADHGYRPEGL